MQKRARILFKLILTAVLSLLFIWLIYTDEKVLQKHLTQPQGELVRAEDVMILAGELGKALDDSGRETVLEGELKAFQNQYFPQSESGPAQYVSYEAYIGLLDLLLKKDGDESRAGQGGEDGLLKNITYENEYEDEFFLLKDDWYDSFGRILKFYGLEDVIRLMDVPVLCGNQNLVGTEVIGERHLDRKSVV